MNKSNNIRNELVIEGTRIGVWDWNVQTGETYFNERWADIIGYTISELEPVSIETWVKFAHPDDLEKSNLLIQEHFAGKTEYYDFQSRMRHKDGHWVWVHDRGKVFEWDKDGNPLRVCGSHIEITDQKELELNLKRALNERDVLLKEVHHRVKNNLQLLLSLARLKDKKGFIETFELEDSINSIARAYEAIYRSENLEKIKIGDYFEQIVDPIIKVHGVNFFKNIEDQKQSIDFLIPLGLILTELLNNSIKYAFKDVIEKRISLIAKEDDGKLILRYFDNGIGYGKEILQNQEGTGSFGMTIIKGLIDQIDGSIRFYNDKGACAEITLTITAPKPH